MDKDEKLKYAIEELNRWLRKIEDSLWQISSIIILGTAYAIAKAVEMKGENLWIIFWGLIMILLWYLYVNLIKDISFKSQFYLKKINEFENDFGVDILPDDFVKNGIDLDQNIFSTFFIKFTKLKIFSRSTFFDFMLIITIVVWISWLFFIFQYFWISIDWTNILNKIFCK